MPSLNWNETTWDTHSDWSGAGDEWSAPWGGPAMQWHATLLPRIQAYVPAGTILEIAPGFGRWTAYLKDLGRKLVGVDLSVKCVEGCRQRFAGIPHLEFHANDGTSLPMVGDRSIDFAFSFDSLVHVELDVLASYFRELGRVLTANGVAFLHHSNMGEYAAAIARFEKLPRGKHRLEAWGLIERNPHNRGLTVTAAGVQQAAAAAAGLTCISQELINWGSKRLTDCISVLTPIGSKRAQPTRLLRNPHYGDEVAAAKRLAELYAAPRAH